MTIWLFSEKPNNSLNVLPFRFKAVKYFGCLFTFNFRCNRDSELSFPGFGSTCGGSASSMAYLKSAPYPVPGLGIHGLPVDSLHSSMGYPGKNYFPVTYQK